jgi:outer membrane lipoprotein SlyB
MSRKFFRQTKRVAPVLALTAVLGMAGCVPVYTNTTYTGADIGRTAQVSFGVILSMRGVIVQSNGGGGVGTLAGAAAGGVAGSFIGGGARSNILGAIGGAVLGGVVGSAIEGSVSQSQAVEFIIREDSGQTISVVQTNEEDFRPGDRVTLTRGARTRIGRAGG